MSQTNGNNDPKPNNKQADLSEALEDRRPRPSNTSENIGQGVKRIEWPGVDDDTGGDQSDQEGSSGNAGKPKEVSLDSRYEWVDRPQWEGQLEDPNSSRFSGQHTFVFDMLDPDQRAKYDELHTQADGPYAHCSIDFEFERTLNETIYFVVRVKYYKFKKFTNPGRNVGYE